VNDWLNLSEETPIAAGSDGEVDSTVCDSVKPPEVVVAPPTLWLGRTFKDKGGFKDVVHSYGVTNGKQLKFIKNDKVRCVYAIGLVIAALIYPAFAVINGGVRHVGTEVIGVAVFSTIALLGLRLSPLLLAFGWTAHVAWDVLLHWGDGTSAYVPSWYPTVCVGFDLLLAGYIVAALRSRDPS